MEIRNIKTFIKVAERGSFSKAAQELGYAQSTVTMQIRAIEEELSVLLFERNGKHVVLSTAGREFLEYAYSITSVESQAIAHFSTSYDPQGLLCIGIVESLYATKHVRFFLDYMKKYPKVALRTMVGPSGQLIEWLDSGEADMIMTLDRLLIRSNWFTEYSIPTKMVFFCSPEHPFAWRKDICVDELIRQNLIILGRGERYHWVLDHFLEERGKIMKRITQLGSTQFVQLAVREGLGVGLLPRYAVAEAVRAGNAAFFHVTDYDTDVFLQIIVRSNRWTTPAMRAMIEEAKEYGSLGMDRMSEEWKTY